MNNIAALHELLKQAASTNRPSLAGYKRAIRALRTLGFNNEDSRHALADLGYVKYDTGEPWDWLAKKLTEGHK